MATQVVMPKLSPTMEEGQLARWLKKEGDKVSMGEPLAEIDTDKATMEMQALSNGVLRKILIQEGESAPLGQPIAIVGEPDEDISELLKTASEAKPAKADAAPKEQPESEAVPAVEAKAHEPEQAQAAAVISSDGKGQPAQAEGRVLISPIAARMAAEAGLDFKTIQGSGPGGRIVKKDIKTAMSGKSQRPAATPGLRPMPRSSEKGVVYGPSAY